MSVSSSWFITENTQDLIWLYHNSQPWFNATLTKLYIIYSDIIFNGTNQFLSGLDYIIIFGKYNTSIVKTGNQQRIRVIKIDKCKTDTKFSSWPFWNSVPSIHWAHYLFQFLPNFPFAPTNHFPQVLLTLSHHFHFLFFPLTFLRILSIVVVSSYHLMTPMMMFMTMIFMMTIFMTMIFMMMMFMTLLGMILMTMTMEYSPLCRAPTGAGPGSPEYKRKIVNQI